MMDILYYSCLLLLNLLFLEKYLYFEKDLEVKILLEEVITTIVYFMVAILLVKFMW